MAKRAGLPWDVMLGAETARAYKPMPQAYQRQRRAAQPGAARGDAGGCPQRRPGRRRGGRPAARRSCPARRSTARTRSAISRRSGRGTWWRGASSSWPMRWGATRALSDGCEPQLLRTGFSLGGYPLEPAGGGRCASPAPDRSADSPAGDRREGVTGARVPTPQPGGFPEDLAILRGGCPPQRAAFRPPRSAIFRSPLRTYPPCSGKISVELWSGRVGA